MSNPFNKEDKLFSIVTPIYGETALDLPRWVEALSKQEYKHFEAIVVFDGPNRKGKNILNKLMRKYPDIDLRYYVIPHAGACAARNYGAKQAKGEYIAFPGGDCYLYPQALRLWANAFDEKPKANRVWGLYDILDAEGTKHYMENIGVAPRINGEIWYGAFKFAPHTDGTFPFRKSDFVGWDENCKSLQDWEISIRMLKRDNFEGKDWVFIPHSFFEAEAPRVGGLSNDSNENWVERKKYLKGKNGIGENDTCVVSHGAPAHGIAASQILNADYNMNPALHKHEYKTIYLLGFYTQEDPQHPGFVTRSHMNTFGEGKHKKVLHWIGTDVYQLRRNCSFDKIKELKEWFKEEKIIHLCECDWIQKELKEVGIKARIVPIPPKKIYKPMPLPKKFTVGIYMPHQAQGSQVAKHSFYYPDLIEEVVRACPDIQFYLFGSDMLKGEKGDNYEYLGYIDYDKWMPKMSCNLRLTVHDGLPLTSVQFMTAGRNVVTNQPLKGAIRCAETRESIISCLREAQNKQLSAQITKYWQKALNYDKYRRRIKNAR